MCLRGASERAERPNSKGLRICLGLSPGDRSMRSAKDKRKKGMQEGAPRHLKLNPEVRLVEGPSCCNMCVVNGQW